MNKVRWGIIGCGDVTEVKSGPAFSQVENSELVAVMRRNTEKAKDYAKRHSVPTWYDDAEKLISDNNIDAIYIATPPSSHLEYTVISAEAGKPVYVEKPMAAGYKQCTDMINICKNNNVKLFTAYYRRELHGFKKIKKVIDSGRLGEIKFVNIKLYWPVDKNINKNNIPWRYNPEISGAGLFFDLASHQLDYLDYILGPIKEARGNFTNQAGLYKAEDIVSASLIFESNIIGAALWCFTMNESDKLDNTEIIETNGKINFSFFDQTPIELIIEGNKELIKTNWAKHVQEPLIKTVVNDLLGKGKCISTGETAARTNWVMDKILNRI
jgi:predicted dehydrogenase